MTVHPNCAFSRGSPVTLNDFILSLQVPPYQSLTALFLLLTAAYGIGSPLLCRGRWHGSASLREFTGFVLGLDLLALLFRLGERLVCTMPATLPAVVLAIPSGYGVWLLLKQLPAICRRHWLLLLLAVAGATWTLGSAFCMPYAWDEQVYQTALPFRYLASGSAAMVLDNPYSAFPAMQHFLMMPAIRLGGVVMPRMLIWAVYPILFVWFFLALRRFGRLTAVAITLALLLSPVVAAMNRENYAEPFIVLNLFAGACAVRGLVSVRSAALLTGIFAGMAAAVKLTAGGVSLALLLLLAGRLLRNGRRIRPALPLLAGFCGAALAAAFPFYLRSFLVTGNPFYPFGSGILHPGSTAAAVETYHTLLGRHLYGLEGWWSPAVAWIFAGFDEKLFDGVVLGLQLPLMIAASGIALFLLHRRGKARSRVFLVPLLAALAIYLFWGYSSQQTRFLLPFCFVAGWAMAALAGAFPRKIRFGLYLLLLAAAYESILFPALRHYELAWKMQKENRTRPVDFVARTSRDGAYFAMLDYLSRETPANSRVLLLFERRGLFVPREYRIGTPYFQEQFFTPVPERPDAVLDALWREKIDYILVGATEQNPEHLEVYDRENLKLSLLLRSLLRAGSLRLIPVPGGGDYTLLAVEKPSDGKITEK